MKSSIARRSDRPKRRWGQFSLRSMLLLVALVAVWLTVETSRSRRQAKAVMTIQKLGGIVKFDYEYDKNGRDIPNAISSVPHWLRSSIGEDYFRTVVTLDIAVGSFRDRNRQPPKAVDEALNAISNLPDLRILEIGANPAIDDESLAHLSGLRKLRTLYLYRTGIEGPGLRQLRGSAEIESLSLDQTPLSDEGLVSLRDLPKLRWLRLANTKITDAGLLYLIRLPALEELCVDNTDVSDFGLKTLSSLTKLQRLSANGTQITSAGVATLQQALPKCVVSPSQNALNRQPRDFPLWSPGHDPTPEWNAPDFCTSSYESMGWVIGNRVSLSSSLRVCCWSAGVAGAEAAHAAANWTGVW